MNEPQGQALVSPETAKILDNITQTAKRCRELEAENDRLSALNADLARERDFFRRELDTAEKKRDMYHRHAVALFTRLSDMITTLDGYRSMLVNALSEARIESKAATEEPALTPEDEKRVAALAQTLAPDQGDRA